MQQLLAIDAGTTGVTALLFDHELQPLSRATAEFPQHFPQPGWVEHQAHEILAATDRVVARVLEDADELIGVGLTNQRETIFAWDQARGQAIGSGIVWQDRRTAARCQELKQQGLEAQVRAKTGLLLDPYFSASKMEWLLRERSEVRQAQDRGHLQFLTVDALLVHHLTGGGPVATDQTNASRTLLFDLDRRGWDAELMDLFGVKASSLPEALPSVADYGLAQLPGGRKVPIRGIAGDQQAALFGQGGWEAGDLKNTYGTGCFLLLHTGEQRYEGEGLLTTLAAGTGERGGFALEGSVFAGGAVVQWLRDQLGVLEQAADSEAVAESVSDTGGVYLIPAFAGLGAPDWDPDARAALLGMTRGTSRAHIVRAGLDAIAFQCAELVDLLRSATGLAVEELRVDGGASANRYLMQRQADLAGLRIERASDVEATARGAAALAGVGAGLFDDPASARASSATETTFEPQLDTKQRRAELRGWRAAVERVRTG